MYIFELKIETRKLDIFITRGTHSKPRFKKKKKKDSFKLFFFLKFLFD